MKQEHLNVFKAAHGIETHYAECFTYHEKRSNGKMSH